MRFTDAANLLKDRGVTLDEIAAEFDVTVNTIQRWKQPEHKLKPRQGWEGVLARLAERRIEGLEGELNELRDLRDALAAKVRPQA